LASIHETIHIEADADSVWSIATEPDWLELRERIVQRSDRERSFASEIIDAPLPMRSYVSRVTVEGHDGHSHVDVCVELEGEHIVDEPELIETLRGAWRDGLERLRERLES
jgi:hypothetical protein